MGRKVYGEKRTKSMQFTVITLLHNNCLIIYLKQIIILLYKRGGGSNNKQIEILFLW